MLVKSFLIGMREGEELKAPRHASAAATRNGNLPSRDGKLPYVMATCLIPDTIRLILILSSYPLALLSRGYYKIYLPLLSLGLKSLLNSTSNLKAVLPKL
jgi:hypothetical protein